MKYENVKDESTIMKSEMCDKVKEEDQVKKEMQVYEEQLVSDSESETSNINSFDNDSDFKSRKKKGVKTVRDVPKTKTRACIRKPPSKLVPKHKGRKLKLVIFKGRCN